jgi:uncharacterized membrane protein
MHASSLPHVVAGGLGLLSGAVALYGAKGSALHRRSGTVFVYTMLAMGLSGTAMAALRGHEGSVIAGLLTAYLVLTAMTTVRPPAHGARALQVGALLLALCVGTGGVAVGGVMLAHGERARAGIPVAMFFIHGSLALLGAAGDLRLLRTGPLAPRARLTRHLWRMCVALFLGTASFFLGQVPRLVHAPRLLPLLALGAFLPLGVMAYWLLRLRRRAPSAGGAAHLEPL